MQNRSLAGIEPDERLGQHVLDHDRERTFCNLVRHDLPVVEVHHRRQVQLLVVDLELGHVGHPLLVGLIRCEVALQAVRRRLGSRAFIGLVAFGANQRLQLHLDHQLLDCLVVDDEPLLAQFSGDPAIAIPTLVTVEDLADLRLQVAVC
jgi:hypothetical protein